jgi:hypothetical protein
MSATTAARDARRPASSESGRFSGLTPQRYSPRVVAVCAVGLGAVAAAARIPGAIGDSFWEDEVASAHVLIQPAPWGMLHQVARTEATPPLWYALGWVLNQFGLSPMGYRWASVLAGALLAGATVLVALRVVPLWASAVAGVLVALGWQFVMHGRELRAYELFALVTVVFCWVLIREWQLAPTAAGWRRYILPLVVACGALTNYFFLLSVIAALVWVWFDPEVREMRGRVARQIGIGLIPLAVWFPVTVHQYLGAHFSWIGPFSLSGWTDVYWELLAKRTPAGTLGWALPLLLLLAIVGGSMLLARRSAPGRLIGLLAVAPVALAGLAWLGGAHVFDPRNLLATGPFAAIALTVLLVRAPIRLGYPLGLAVTALMSVGVVRWESTPPTPYQTVAQILVSQGWQPQDPIVVFGALGQFFAFRSPLEWYLPHQPTLTLGEPEAGRWCSRVYALAQFPGAPRDVARSSLVTATGRAGQVLVARLRSAPVPVTGFWRGGHVLAVRREARPCVRLLGEAQIIPALER